jgi:hypothetical protein
MMKKLITVIYPGERVMSYVVKTELEGESLLEMVFGQFNYGSGSECEVFLNSRCRSMCVNDIVAVNGEYWQCGFVGWKSVTAKYVEQLEDEVVRHLLYDKSNGGAWDALNDIMWNQRKKEQQTA